MSNTRSRKAVAGTLALGSIAVVVVAVVMRGNLKAAPTTIPGDVLIAGGDLGFPPVAGMFVHSTSASQIYDPTTGTFVPVGAMAHDREGAFATSLPSGKILVGGGASCTVTKAGLQCAALNTAELFDPSSGTYAAAGTGSGSVMTSARGFASAMLISGCGCAEDGKVLIAGGFTGTLSSSGAGTVTTSVNATAEIYDPGADTFTALANKMITAREVFAMAPIPGDGGRILIAGGDDTGFFEHSLAAAEIYDPSTQTFTATGSLNTARELALPTPLDPTFVTGTNAGKILVTGGLNAVGHAVAVSLNSGSLSSAELFDPAANSGVGAFAPAGNTMSAFRAAHTAVLFQSGPLAGEVLVAGGVSVSQSGSIVSSVSQASADIYDPTSGATGAFRPTGNMIEARGGNAFALLTIGPNAGDVLVAGGEDCSASGCYIDGSAGAVNDVASELYDPGTGKWTATTNAMMPGVNIPAQFGIVIQGPAGAPTATSTPGATPTPTATPAPTPVAPPVQVKLKVKPPSINFGGLALAADSGTAQPSGSKKVVVMNPGGKHGQPVTFGDVSTSTADFVIQSNGCSGALSPGKSCTILLGFTPSILGDEGAQQLTISDNAIRSPQVVLLRGKALAPSLKLSTKSINFGKVTDTGQSADQRLILKNLNKFVPITIDGESIVQSGANDFSNDFGVDTETCTGAPIPPGGTCEIDLFFTPLSGGGPEAAELDISDDALGSPQAVKLKGTDVAIPGGGGGC